MATATKNTNDVHAATEQVTERVTELSERLVEAGKHAGNLYLDSYDKLVDGVTSFQQRLAEQSDNDAVKSVITAQVDITRELASAYTSAARGLIA